MRLFFTILLFMVFVSTAVAGHLHKEKEYQDAWCADHGGVTEYRLDDGTRVDCLTEEYSVEFDFAPKWAEATGQALYYGLKTDKKPGVVLILEKDGDQRYISRLQLLADRYGMKTWTMSPQDVSANSDTKLR